MCKSSEAYKIFREAEKKGRGNSTYRMTPPSAVVEVGGGVSAFDRHRNLFFLVEKMQLIPHQRKEKKSHHHASAHVPEEFDEQALEKQFDLGNAWVSEEERVEVLKSLRVPFAVNDALREAISPSNSRFQVVAAAAVRTVL